MITHDQHLIFDKREKVVQVVGTDLVFPEFLDSLVEVNINSNP